jgi:hypothetical protein
MTKREFPLYIIPAVEYSFHSQPAYDPRAFNFLMKIKFAQQISHPQPNPAAPHPNHMHTPPHLNPRPTSLLHARPDQFPSLSPTLPHLIPWAEGSGGPRSHPD